VGIQQQLRERVLGSDDLQFHDNKMTPAIHGQDVELEPANADLGSDPPEAYPLDEALSAHDTGQGFFVHGESSDAEK
jgi:hypothetical protein